MSKTFFILTCQSVGYIKHHTFDYEDRKIIFNLIQFLNSEASLYQVERVDLFSYPRILNLVNEPIRRMNKPLQRLKNMVKRIPETVGLDEHDEMIYNKVLVMLEHA